MLGQKSRLKFHYINVIGQKFAFITMNVTTFNPIEECHNL
jgi:hypothetical protein